ncbi:organic hydroperoxide resistance protein [Kineosporia rhizophila]|uniref:organic hydroperoxide resistance protein n=1 Tax=Kineosporia TaxID=49184 RepID=UPI001E3369DB|nr:MULTISPECIES: organic hydroperoxide resistance protein [Kineosporia]MCE0533991.1 organic hydroperoxide resistance protein [Kineosporia rhizophila]GLY13531.1 organic hydroperoxide resistance protein [Kineosporia sp. NBRC 101677]
MPEALYSATSTAWGGREGRAASSDGRIDVSLSMPAGLGGDDGPGTNPEQLFATGYAACFHSALKGAARSQQVDLSDSAVSVTISLLGSSETGLDLAARIEAQVGGVDAATAGRLLELAHQMCPYSRATRGNISQEVVLIGPDPE